MNKTKQLEKKLRKLYDVYEMLPFDDFKARMPLYSEIIGYEKPNDNEKRLKKINENRFVFNNPVTIRRNNTFVTGNNNEYEFVNNEGFFGISNLKSQMYRANEDINLKFYLCIDEKNIQAFMKECFNLMEEYNIPIHVQTRFSKATDMVTLSLYDESCIGKVYNIIEKYAVKDKDMTLIPHDENGIGITIDKNQSYNFELTKLLQSYFADCKEKKEVKAKTFLEFLKSETAMLERAERLDEEAKIILYNISNLTNEGAFLLQEVAVQKEMFKAEETKNTRR